jgi:hypothetical protein
LRLGVILMHLKLFTMRPIIQLLGAYRKTTRHCCGTSCCRSAMSLVAIVPEHAEPKGSGLTQGGARSEPDWPTTRLPWANFLPSLQDSKAGLGTR